MGFGRGIQASAKKKCVGKSYGGPSQRICVRRLTVGRRVGLTSQIDAVRTVIHALDLCGIQYMVVGSFAASMYGISRNTHDMDIVVALPSEAVIELAQALGEDFFFDEIAAREAADRADMFNILHLDSNLKVDFFVLRGDPFSQVEFERRVQIEAWGAKACVASPEDTILSKLLWNKISPSERQLEDVIGVLREMQDVLDYEYLRHWADEVGVRGLLDRMIEESA
jgi:hypothetical protein